jgi:PPIC-type PPIASE domain
MPMTMMTTMMTTTTSATMPKMTSTGKVRAVDRRPAVLACAASLAMLSSCSTFSHNDDAARVGDRRLSAETARGFVASDAEPTSGDLLRDQLTSWIRVSVLEASSGAAAQAEPSTAAELETRLSQALAAVGASRAKALYETGVASSPLICLAAIPVASTDDANHVLATLQSGTTFADAAHQFSTDTTTADAGGVVTGADGEECFDATTVNPDVITALTGAEVGEPVVAALSAFSAVLMMRPYDDLLPASQSRVASLSVGADELTAIVDAAKIYVDPRYGRWDPSSGSVVALSS